MWPTAVFRFSALSSERYLFLRAYHIEAWLHTVRASFAQVVNCTLSTLQHQSTPMQQLARSVLQIATSSQGVNRRVDVNDFISSCEKLKGLLEGLVVDDSQPVLYPSEWERQRQRVEKEISSQAEYPKPAMTKAVLQNLESFFRCESFRKPRPAFLSG